VPIDSEATGSNPVSSEGSEARAAEFHPETGTRLNDITTSAAEQTDAGGTGRRTVLKRAAVAGGVAAWVAPLVLSSAAHADSGTPKCRFKPTVNASVTATISRPASNQAQFNIIAIANPTGACPCGGTPVFSYAYWGAVTGTSTVSASAGGWVSFSSAQSGALTIGGGTGAFSYQLEVGIRVQCAGRGATPAFYCRFVLASGSGATSYTLASTPLTATTNTNLGVTC
jgi:hypothetical protein